MSGARKLARARAFARDPIEAAVRWSAQRNAATFVDRHARLARRVGIDRPYLILSFDCDTGDDTSVAWEVHSQVRELGINPVYAVPGELLRDGEPVFTRIRETGAEFLNHGGVRHTYFDERLARHASCFFYDQLPSEAVRRDVEMGDQMLREVLGVIPQGFRTPHFGTYQDPEQLRYLHGVLAGLGYRFSTSTMPRFGLRHGPVASRGGILELPVTGVPEAPHEVFDTWAFFAAPDRVRDPLDYVRQAKILATALERAGAGLINVYGDPLHIHDRPEFFEALRVLTRVTEPIGYDVLLDRIVL